MMENAIEYSRVNKVNVAIIPTRKDKAHSLPTPKGGGIPRRFDER